MSINFPAAEQPNTEQSNTLEIQGVTSSNPGNNTVESEGKKPQEPQQFPYMDFLLELGRPDQLGTLKEHLRECRDNNTRSCTDLFCALANPMMKIRFENVITLLLEAGFDQSTVRDAMKSFYDRVPVAYNATELKKTTIEAHIEKYMRKAFNTIAGIHQEDEEIEYYHHS